MIIKKGSVKRKEGMSKRYGVPVFLFKMSCDSSVTWYKGSRLRKAPEDYGSPNRQSCYGIKNRLCSPALKLIGPLESSEHFITCPPKAAVNSSKVPPVSENAPESQRSSIK